MSWELWAPTRCQNDFSINKSLLESCVLLTVAHSLQKVLEGLGEFPGLEGQNKKSLIFAQAMRYSQLGALKIFSLPELLGAVHHSLPSRKRKNMEVNWNLHLREMLWLSKSPFKQDRIEF